MRQSRGPQREIRGQLGGWGTRGGSSNGRWPWPIVLEQQSYFSAAEPLSRHDAQPSSRQSSGPACAPALIVFLQRFPARALGAVKLSQRVALQARSGTWHI